MSFIKINGNNFEQVTLALRPHTEFISSSVGLGSTGSAFVSPLRSKAFKQDMPSTDLLNTDKTVSEEAIAELLSQIEASPHVARDKLRVSFHQDKLTNIFPQAQNYLNSVGSSSQIQKNTKKIDVLRFDLPVLFNKNRNIKNIVKNVFMPFHRHRYDNCYFAYSNYHTLNFFNSETVPTGSALIYPNVETAAGGGVYDLPDEFCINFWINPRYSNKNYKAGTVLHLSSSVAISIVSGSSKDEFNEPDTFKLLLQLSQSADKPPSTINLSAPSGRYPSDLIFTSSHFLKRNHWHNVTVQWSQKVNNAFGSIFIDNDETRFYVPSASVSANADNSPGGFVVGNYYDGSVNNLSHLLNNASGSVEGFTGVIPSNPAFEVVVNKDTFGHPLNGEVHEIRMFNKIFSDLTGVLKPVSDLQIMKSSGQSNTKNLKFYVPPFFYPTSSKRDVLVTPFQKFQSTTDDPMNVSFSLGVNGKFINLENFTREFVVGQQPRHFGLVPQTIDKTIQNITADQYVYDTGSHKKRNFTILPNDNGQFIPNYFVLNSSTEAKNEKFYMDPTNKRGKPDHSMISLENLIISSSLHPGLVQSTGEIFDKIASASAQNPGVTKGAVLTIAQRTRDRSSNEIVIFDISNLYYGNRINPGTVEIFDKDLTGSDGKIKILLKDNGRGSIYRADALTQHAKWNNLGNVFYDEGIVLLKTPHLFFFCKDETNLKFRGEQNIHTMTIDVPVYKDFMNSSSNPTFKKVAPSLKSNDEELSTLYVTTVNIHDDNFNIIMKANFAQPIFKTEEDEFVIRLKEDF